MTKTGKNKLATLDRKIFSRIYGPKRNDEGEYNIRINREIEVLYEEANIVGDLKIIRLS